MEGKFKIGNLVGLRAALGTFIDAPFYQITNYDPVKKNYELTRVNVKYLNPVYCHPVKDSFHESGEKIHCVYFRKGNCLSRPAQRRWNHRAVDGFLHYFEASENGEYGYDD